RSRRELSRTRCEYSYRFLCRKNLFQGHATSFVPGSSECLFSQLGADSSHCWFIVKTFQWRNGTTHALAQGRCRPPEANCPHFLSLCSYAARQAFQAVSALPIVIYLAC